MKNYFQILFFNFFLLWTHALTAQMACNSPRIDINAIYTIEEISTGVVKINGGFGTGPQNATNFKFNVTITSAPIIVQNMTINFGSSDTRNLGFTQAELPKTWTFDIDYANFGTKTITVTTGPTVATASQVLNSTNFSRVLTSANYLTPTKTELITGASFTPVCQGFLPIAKDGQAGSASIVMHTLLSPSNTTGHVRRPLIFLEGIDFGTVTLCDPNTSGDVKNVHVGDFGWDNFITGVFEDPADSDNETFGQLPTLITQMRNEGFDIIFCDFVDGADWIQKNGLAVIAVIEKVNSEKKLGTPSGMCFPNMIVGASMGGQVAKWALRTMELQGKNHDAALYVSFDSPQQGANIPLCIQSFIWFNANFGDAGSRAELTPRWNALNRPAAQQLLVHHFNKIEQTNGCDLRQLFAAEMSQLGYPINTRNIATANGNGAGTGQGYSNSALLGDFRGMATVLGITTPLKIFNAQLSASGAPVINDMSKVTQLGYTVQLSPPTVTKDITLTRMEVLLLNPNQVKVNFTKREERYGINISFPIKISPIGSTTLTFNHDIRNWDNASGGNRHDIRGSLKNGIEKALAGYTFIDNPTGISDALNRQAFIPSISSLDIQTGVDNVSFNISTGIGGNPLAPDPSVTPFAAVFFPNSNEGHVQVSTALGNFIIAQMQAAQVTLQSPLAEPYNYGLIRATIPSVTVASGGILAVNNSGRTAYVNRTTSEASAAKPVFEALITSGCDANVVVQSGGKIQLGAGWSNSGILRILTGSTLTLQGGSTVEVNNASQIVVEKGGKLIINAGANINLASATAQIIIKNGGELIINGNFTYTGTGYFSFESGNKLTLNSDWVLTGVDRNTRLINVEDNATVTVNEGHRWTIQNALVRKVGTISNDVLVLRNGATFFAENVTFDDKVAGGSASFVSAKNAIDLDNSPDDMDYSFRNCTFANTLYGIWIEGADLTNRFDFRNINVEIINTTFTNCPLAYVAEHGYITDINGCTITGGGIDIQRMYWLRMSNTTMRGGSANSVNSTTGINLAFSIHNWIRGNNIISDYGTGIDASHHGTIHSMNGNIILSDKSTIQSCQTAIKQDGGADYGLLYMDCTAILRNQLGITGTDILLSAYSRGNTANIYTRPDSKFGGLFFKNTFDVRQETDIWLFGSYWNNPTYLDDYNPSETSVNNFWEFRQNGAPWQGSMHIKAFATADAVNNSCGGVQLRDAPTDSLALTNSIVQVNNEYRNVRIQQDAALSQLKQNNLAEAIALFTPVAEIINGVRDTANAAVRHFVDVARTMALGANGVTIRSKSKGWLPETLVEVPKKIENSQFMVYPNPANTSVQMELKKGNYYLRVSNAIGQSIFAQNTEGVLSVNVSTWTNGIYLFELTDKATNKRQHSKIVIQH